MTTMRHPLSIWNTVVAQGGLTALGGGQLRWSWQDPDCTKQLVAFTHYTYAWRIRLETGALLRIPQTLYRAVWRPTFSTPLQDCTLGYDMAFSTPLQDCTLGYGITYFTAFAVSRKATNNACNPAHLVQMAIITGTKIAAGLLHNQLAAGDKTSSPGGGAVPLQFGNWPHAHSKTL
jgi:hypothetical protein